MLIKLFEMYNTDILGTRYEGEKLRIILKKYLENTKDIIYIDFNNINVVTHSFLDQAVGTLFSEYGPIVFKRIKFKNAQNSVKSIGKLIKIDRVRDFIFKPDKYAYKKVPLHILNHFKSNYHRI
ncbi:Putative anti-sigma factor [Marinitoga phage MPV1]|uniref:DUF4325 domain-containing protein n=1 Tax=Marinitoga piezophila (strain DSM 14283 / JCM 11233 / KA3) TaxID=443254 RepID=H2J416_MARPK|nr:STAS-like domain-containing protein [Marinitoga piezophila]AEX84744.1 hypothetical protein Marpi_0293 [Marinitoga piezophila KA3]